MTYASLILLFACASFHLVLLYCFWYGLGIYIAFFHAVSVTWNNSSTITGPVLIFHDEGFLSCQSSVNVGVAWHLPNRTTVSLGNITELGVFFQVISSERMTSLLLATGLRASNVEDNGLWSCRLNGDAGSAFPVGLYQRGCEYSIVLAIA